MSTMSRDEKMSNTHRLSGGVGSNPESRTSGMKSPPSNSNAGEGIKFLNDHLRSVLTNRMFFEVFVLINRNLVDVGDNSDNNKKTATTTNASEINYDFLRSIIPQDRMPLIESNHFWKNEEQFQGLLSTPINNKDNSGETDITKQMVRDLKCRLDDVEMSCYVTEHIKTTSPTTDETVVVWDEGNLKGVASEGVKGSRSPRLDVSIGLKNTLLAFVEVGVEPSCDKIDELFSKKTAQSHKYLKGLYSSTGAVWKTEGRNKAVLTASGRPILFAVIVFSKDRSIGRMAIFAAEPKPDDGDLRVAMIWRKEASGDKAIEELDQAYSAFIHAIKYSATYFQNESDCDQDWEYLGPDCVKVRPSGDEVSFVLLITNSFDIRCCYLFQLFLTFLLCFILSFIILYQRNFQNSYVLRVYDNRVRSTSRSPYLYLLDDDDDNPLKDDYSVKNGSVKKVLTFVDGGDKAVLEFGKKPIKDDHRNAQGWMLFGGKHVGFKGQIQIIAVRYYEGQHVCRNIGQAYDIVDKVVKLHEKNLVHGDIRGCNLVFSAKGSYLIDLDFGGKVGEVIFPPSYVPLLPDGDRIGANAGDPITKDHDLWALLDSFLFTKHILTSAGEISLLKAAEGNPIQLQMIRNVVEDKDDDGNDEITSTGLLEFVKMANELDREAKFRPNKEYKKFLKTLRVGSLPEATRTAGVPTAPTGVLEDRMKKKKKETPKEAQFSPFGLSLKASPMHYTHFLPQPPKRRRVGIK